MIKTVRYMDAPNLAFILDVYDSNDTLIDSMAMPETAIAGIYRADVLIVSNDAWGIVRDQKGAPVDILRIEPSSLTIAADIVALLKDPEMLTVSKFLGLNSVI